MPIFDDLSEREILALAISNDEEDARIYADFSDGLHEDYPASAKVFDEMAAEENTHRRRLIDLFVSKFSDHIPLVRRQDIRGYIPQKPVWQLKPLGLETARAHSRHGAGCGALLSSSFDADHGRVHSKVARRPR
jgi:erythrin-vacuolar iron transport family protein